MIVNGHEFTTWWSARQYCTSIGADFYVPNSEDENNALSRYFDDWKRAGVTSFWLGVTANENCNFMKFNGYPLDYEGWASDEPNCNSETKPQCVHLNILANEKNWKVQDCYAKEAFACQVKVGQKIHQGLF